MKKTITILAITLFTFAGIHPAGAQSNKIIVQSDEPSEGLYVISDVDEEKFGYGKYNSTQDAYVIVIELKYDNASPFVNGMAVVELNGKLGVIDRNENIIIPLKYDAFGVAKNNLLPADINEKSGIINLSGEVIVPIKYDNLYYLDYEESDLYVAAMNKKKGVIDRTDQIVVPLRYDDVDNASEGFIAVEQNGKWGCYNQFGKEIAKPKFDTPFKYKNGLAQVSENGNNYYIDGNGIPQKGYVKNYKEHVKYYENKKEQIKEVGQYDDNNKKTGVWKAYYENGQLKSSCNYLMGKKNGIYKVYFENGQLNIVMDKYVNGKVEGQWKSYHENGNPWTFIQYSNNKQNGKFINHYENGKLESEGNMKDDNKIGEWKAYYENGQLKSVSKYTKYQNRTGEWKTFYDDGKLKGIGIYNEYGDSEWKFYYENGQLESTGIYGSDERGMGTEKTGEWKYYYKDGNLKKTFNH